MARRIPGLRRVLGPGSVASVAYAEIGVSIFIALGVVALYGGSLTPWILLGVGLVFLCVSLSYAEGTAAIPEAGGGALFVRRAFNDPAGFATGWVLLLDYVIVIALAALFVPHYVGAAMQWDAITDEPWDGIVAIAVIGVVAAARLVRRSELYRLAPVIAGVALLAHLLLALLGLVFLFSWDDLTSGARPSLHDIAFACALATLAYTGLETVANYAAETRGAGRTLSRSMFAAIAAVVGATFLLGLVGTGVPDLATEWRRAPLVGIAVALEGSIPDPLEDALRVSVGLAGALVLVAAISTSISGIGRLTYSLGTHGMLPHAFARLSRRTLIAPVAILSAAAAAVVLLVAGNIGSGEVSFLASLYSFGILLAFTAAQLAVIALRFREPNLARPFRAPGDVRIRGVAVPLPALVGAPLTFVLWIAALTTHDAARIVGPLWLLAGAVVYVAVRRSAHEGVLARVVPAEPDLIPEEEEGAYERILVPLKLGLIGEEVLATAVKLGEEHSCTVRVLHVLRVPLELPLDAALPEKEAEAERSLAEVRELATEHGVEVETAMIRARSLGEAIVDEAVASGADLVVMGSAPRWRRQSRFFSPTVDYVLRKAPCEVMVVTYPQGVLEEEAAEVEA
jgi:APA family basic amino acid/polyamine antiporter